MRSKEELDVMLGGLGVFCCVYLIFIASSLGVTVSNQYNLGSQVRFETNTFYGSANTTLVTLASYSGISLTLILPIIILGVFLLVIISGYFSYLKLKGVNSEGSKK